MFKLALLPLFQSCNIQSDVTFVISVGCGVIMFIATIALCIIFTMQHFVKCFIVLHEI